MAMPNGNLLSKGKDFNGRVASALKEIADHPEDGQLNSPSNSLL